jgi:hypothetical protein
MVGFSDGKKAAQQEPMPAGGQPDWKKLFEAWWNQVNNKYPTYAVVFKAGFDAAQPVDAEWLARRTEASYQRGLETGKAAQPTGEPVYQIMQAYPSDPENTWRDARKSAYDMHLPGRRRMLYTRPAASTGEPAGHFIPKTVNAFGKVTEWDQVMSPHGTALYTHPASLVPMTNEILREAKVIVHGDGNIFFTNVDQLNRVIEAHYSAIVSGLPPTKG